MPIGSVPKGAPLRCKLGRHIGQERGGLMVYACTRCGGSFWQDNDNMRSALSTADAMIDAGRSEDALRFARDVIDRETS